MIEIFFQTFKHKNYPIDQPLLSDEIESPIFVSETQRYRFMSKTDQSDVNIDIYIGGFKLTEFQDIVAEDNVKIFSLDIRGSELQLEKKLSYNEALFKTLFINQNGYTELIIEIDEKKIEIPFIVESTKISAIEINKWLTFISEKFPIFKSPYFSTPISSVVTSDVSGKFGSLSSFIRQTEEFINKIHKRMSENNYLKNSIDLVVYEDTQKFYFSPSNPSKFFNTNREWNKIPYNTSQLVRKGFVGFEPKTFPKHKAKKNYNHGLNTKLLLLLESLNKILKHFNKEIDQSSSNIKNAELRGAQFDTNESKELLFLSYRKKLTVLSKKLLKIIELLYSLGIKNNNKIIEDIRYKSLNNDIVKLEIILEFYKNIDASGNNFVGIPSIDLIFEYFCYAKVIDQLQKNNFIIVDVAESTPLNYYIKLKNKENGINIRIFHDFGVPIMSSLSSPFPLKDVFTKSIEKRPDFIIHLYNKDFEALAILDAKYILPDKIKNKFKKWNSDNLIVKYGTKFFQTTGIGSIPIFVGAISLSQLDKVETRYISLIDKEMDFSSDIPVIQQAGIIEVNASNDDAIDSFFKSLINHFNILSEKSLKYNISNIDKPEKYIINTPKIQISNYTRDERNSTTRNRLNSAPTLDENDASVIKGMIKRGDKHQDIAMFFGVNTGRITEISQETKFVDVKEIESIKLPPSGPYPPLRNFLNFSKEDTVT